MSLKTALRLAGAYILIYLLIAVTVSAFGGGVGTPELVVALTVALVASVLATKAILRSSRQG